MSPISVSRPGRITQRPNSGSIRIELASSEDWQALSELEKASFSGDRISARSWRSFLANASATITVARDASSRIVGAAVVLERANTCVTRLYSIAIAPHARGRGLSAALLADATQRMRDAGATVMRLETRLDNFAAQHLFERGGFVQRGRKSSYYEDGEDALLYQKPLGDLGSADETVPGDPT